MKYLNIVRRTEFKAAYICAKHLYIVTKDNLGTQENVLKSKYCRSVQFSISEESVQS